MDLQPLVGVCADRKDLNAHPFHVAGEKYLTAIQDGAQAYPIIIPALGARACVNQILERVDGLVFPGSRSNVDPDIYGGPASRTPHLHDPERDLTALPLMRAAIDRGIPIFAICRGFQELNVALGGTLHQYVHEVEGMLDHRERLEDSLDVQYAPSHPIILTEGGYLSRWVGTQSVRVNSLHWQGIDRLADGLFVEAVAKEDGLIEAIRVDAAQVFSFGVQWHPEWKYAEDVLSRRLFQEFGAACLQRHRQRGSATAL